MGIYIAVQARHLADKGCGTTPHSGDGGHVPVEAPPERWSIHEDDLHAEG